MDNSTLVTINDITTGIKSVIKLLAENEPVLYLLYIACLIIFIAILYLIIRALLDFFTKKSFDKVIEKNTEALGKIEGILLTIGKR